MLLEPVKADELVALQSWVDARLEELLPGGREHGALRDSLRHSLLAPGKRLRPAMIVFTAESLGGNGDLALDSACAIEMVHSASLVLDDLPCMDDARIRRGEASNHCRFGVATALLTAVSLLNRAPQVIAVAEGLDADLRLALIDQLSKSAGDLEGLAAGQNKDLRAAAGTLDLALLERICIEKTASLFRCCAQSGALIAGANSETLEELNEFARGFGLAYQILDDVADMRDGEAELGKNVRQDEDKATFATVLGSAGALELARKHATKAVESLGRIDLTGSSLHRLTQSTLLERM